MTDQTQRPFFDDLRLYFEQVAAVLRGEADAASIFPNSTDKGMARERVYSHFLIDHLPSACNTAFGGYLFNQQGERSKQIDIIVTNDICPQFNQHNRDGTGKTFACVDGTVAVASVKSFLDRKEVFDVLKNFASIPQHKTDWDISGLGHLDHVDQWPYKVVFAFDGAQADTVQRAMYDFSNRFGSYSRNRQPDMIHVLGKYRLCKFWNDIQYEGRTIKAGSYVTMPVDCDVAALTSLIAQVQQVLLASKCLNYHYDELFYRMFNMPIDEKD